MDRLPNFETCNDEVKYNYIKVMLNYQSISVKFSDHKDYLSQQAELTAKSHDEYLKNIILMYNSIYYLTSALEKISKVTILSEATKPHFRFAFHRAVVIQSKAAQIVLANRFVFPIALSINNISDITNLDLVLLENRSFYEAIPQVADEIYKSQVSPTITIISIVNQILLSPYFLAQNTNLCAIYIPDKRVLKMYQVDESQFHFIQIIENVKKKPKWLCVKKKKYAPKKTESKIIALHLCKKTKNIFQRNKFLPVIHKHCSTQEQLCNSLEKKSKSWTIIVYGQFNDETEVSSYCMNVDSILAGHVTWFDDKSFSWINIPDIVDKDNCPISVGTYSGKNSKLPEKEVIIISSVHNNNLWSREIILI